MRLSVILLAACLLAGCVASPPADAPASGTPVAASPSPALAPPRPEPVGWRPSDGGVPPWWPGFQEDPENQTVRLNMTATPLPDGTTLIQAWAMNVGPATVNVSRWDSCAGPSIILSWVTPAGEDLYGEAGPCVSPTSRHTTLEEPLDPGSFAHNAFHFQGLIQYTPRDEQQPAEPGNHTMTAHVCWREGERWQKCAVRFVTFEWAGDPIARDGRS